jgi:hypothetical protein
MAAAESDESQVVSQWMHQPRATDWKNSSATDWKNSSATITGTGTTTNPDVDSNSAASWPTEQPNDSISICSYRTDSEGDHPSGPFPYSAGRSPNVVDARSPYTVIPPPLVSSSKKSKRGKEQCQQISNRLMPGGASSQDDATDGTASTCYASSVKDQYHIPISNPYVNTVQERKARTDWCDVIDVPEKVGPPTPRMQDPAAFEVQLQLEERGRDMVLKSVGSAGHPSSCCECQFFFFSLTGCKKGQDCKFCHEFHPRAKEKKNRKLHRRLVEAGQRIEMEKQQEHVVMNNETVQQPVRHHFDQGDSIVMKSGSQPMLQKPIQPMLQKPNLKEKALVPEALPPPIQKPKLKEKTAPHMLPPPVPPPPLHEARLQEQKEEQPDYLASTQLSEVQFSENKARLPVLEGYVPVAPDSGLLKPSRPAKHEFVFAIGQQVRLIPLLHEEDPATNVQEGLTYSISPPLPTGLQFDSKTGVISGIVSAHSRYGQPVEHAIKVGVRVLAGGTKMVLGSVTLCEIRIKVRVVNLMDIQHQIRCIHSSGGDSFRVEFSDMQCDDDGMHGLPVEMYQ